MVVVYSATFCCQLFVLTEKDLRIVVYYIYKVAGPHEYFVCVFVCMYSIF